MSADSSPLKKKKTGYYILRWERWALSDPLAHELLLPMPPYLLSDPSLTFFNTWIVHGIVKKFLHHLRDFQLILHAVL
jgi:hypothetical protein